MMPSVIDPKCTYCTLSAGHSIPTAFLVPLPGGVIPYSFFNGKYRCIRCISTPLLHALSGSTRTRNMCVFVLLMSFGNTNAWHEQTDHGCVCVEVDPLSWDKRYSNSTKLMLPRSDRLLLDGCSRSRRRAMIGALHPSSKQAYDPADTHCFCSLI